MTVTELYFAKKRARAMEENKALGIAIHAAVERNRINNRKSFNPWK